MSAVNTLGQVSEASKLDGAVRPDWLDELYPFKSRYVTIGKNEVHYIDEGSGPVLLFLHPNPGWSFTWRDVIKPLRGQFRTIALDYPGFGMSSRIEGKPTLEGYSRLVEQFIDKLDLRDLTIVVHDTSVSIGMGVAARRPELFSGAVISNGFAWSLDSDPPVKRFVAIVASAPFALAIHAFDFFMSYFLKNGKGGNFTEYEKRAYRLPFEKPSTRRVQYQLFRSILKSKHYLNNLEAQSKNIRDLPVLILFGDGDATFEAGWHERHAANFDSSKVVILEGGDHFPQENKPEEMVAAIRAWWAEGAEKRK